MTMQINCYHFQAIAQPTFISAVFDDLTWLQQNGCPVAKQVGERIKQNGKNKIQEGTYPSSSSRSKS